MLPLLFALAGEAVPAPEPQECNGTCVPPGDMAKLVTVLQERKCLNETPPEFKMDPINIIVDRQGRVFFSGADPQPYKLHMKWCNYEAEGTGKVKVLAAVQEPPTYGFRFRPKAFVGMLLVEPFREGKKPKDGLDAGLMVDAFYIKDFNLNVHAGFRSVGAGIGVDIFRSFGAYAGYALAWDGFHHNPEASLWFAFW
jgi:hypothetical protein